MEFLTTHALQGRSSDIKRLSLACVIALLVTLPARAGDLAVSVTQIPFTAIEPPREDMPAVGPLSLELGLGVGFPKMDPLNDYIQWINRNNTGDIDDIDTCHIYTGRLGYRPRPGLRVGVGYDYLEADTEGTVIFFGAPRAVSIDLDVKGVFLFLEKDWPLSVGPVNFLTGARATTGYYWSSYVETEKSYRASGKDEAVGIELGVSLSWLIRRHLSLTVEGAYRWLEFDDYGVAWVSPGNPDAEVDFSGPLVRVFLGGHF
ncbi:MAG: hypothetical protein RRC34_07255 [Lentisphaeria bacterium]|nr:hypothetical protein [Lentisphaeria bacterium]